MDHPALQCWQLISNSAVCQVINDIFKQQPETEKMYKNYRVAALAVLFGLYAVVALIVGVLAAIGRTPRTTSGILLLFWLLTGFILVLGSGA